MNGAGGVVRGPRWGLTLRGRLLLAIAYPLAVAILALAVPLAINLHERVGREIRAEALTDATVVAADMEPRASSRLDARIARAARQAGGRIVVVDAAGRLQADSSGSAPTGTRFTQRPEIARALTGRRVQIERRSDTLGATLLATAVPIVDEDRTVGAVRLTQSTAAVSRATRRAITGIAAVSAIVLLAGLIVALALAGQLARPVRRLQEAAERVTAGELGARAPVEGAREQRSVAEAFNAMTARLGRLLESQQVFVADASHQLRTPLAGMRLRLEEIEHARTTQEAATEARAALAEVDRLARTVDELLVLSRGGEADAPATAVDLAALAHAAGARWGARAAQRGVALDVDADGPLPARASEADVDRALDVLVENALAYGAPGGSLILRARPGRIDVLDAGPGLTPGEEQEVFARFHRGSASAAAPGSGLGLAIAEELSRRWGGTASIVNRADGPGAQATVTFP